MYIQKSILILLPTFLGSVIAAPTTNTSLVSTELSKREVEPWIAAFSDVGCHHLASRHHRIVTPEGCLAWNSNQPGLYFGVNFGSQNDYQTELQLFLDGHCTDKGPHPLFAGDANHAPGNYVQQAPKGVYVGNAPEGICFDGVHRSWPVAADGRPFMSFRPDNGPAF